MGIAAIVYSPVKLFADGIARFIEISAVERAIGCSAIENLAQTIRREDAEILLFDVTDLGSLHAARQVIDDSPQVCAVAIALPEILEHVIACADSGFRSYVPREASLDELGEVMMRALRAELVCDPMVAGGLLRELNRRAAAAPAPAPTTPLTVRERQVFGFMSEGLSNKEIARRLGVSAATVKNHVHNILVKTRLRKRIDTCARSSSPSGQDLYDLAGRRTG